MNPIEQLKAEIESRRDAFSDSLSEEELTQLSSLLDRLASNAKETITKITESLPEEQKEVVQEKVKAKLNDQEVVRRSKMDALAESGIDPFGQAFAVTAHAEDLRNTYGEKTSEELEAENNIVSIAGRIMSKRRMGKIGFMHIQDKSGKIQVVVKKQVVGDDVYEIFKASDLGDIIGVKGKVIKTNAGELSVEVNEYTHLTKALRPLPEKFHGFTDKEERYRRRYVDLIMNEDAKRVAFLRPAIISCIRNYMSTQGFTEVETPILSNLLTGASARPFVTHHNSQNIDMYLRIALELPLKRLLVGGMEAVYEIGRVFRNEGMDTNHNPEFTLMEAYLAYSNLEGMMNLTEGMYKTIAKDVIGKMDYKYNGYDINLDGTWARVSMTDAIKERTGIDFRAINDLDECLKLAEEHQIELEPHEKQYGHIINKFFEKYVEETLIQPTFLYGHPLEISPLTKKNPDDPRFVDRFELFIGGTEFANAYTELNNPIDQLERFEEQLKEKDLGNDEANDIDMDFIEALEYGMPPAGGIGYGIDRLCMLFTEQESIRDVLLFPTMKQRGE
ncbi:MAG: lysine--tRNA ligase [Erysipelotrichaceae bacterium]|nr:lysine--tRNA ligase [Erysipelotrichaceae bacterium]